MNIRTLLMAVATVACCCIAARGSVAILNGLTHVHHLAKGAQFQGTVQLRNNGKTDVRILAYKQDMVSECGANTSFVEPAGSSFSLNPWLTLNVDEKVLHADEVYDLAYSVNVPHDGVEDGTYWLAIMVEGADPVHADKAQGVTVQSKVRYAIQVIVHIGKVKSPALEYEAVQLEQPSLLKVVMKNTGVFAASAQLTLELYDTQGKKVMKIESVRRRIFPLFCQIFTLALQGVPGGKYTGVLVADNGTDLFGSNLALEL